MKRWLWILAAILILLVLSGMVYAMRLNIGASQFSRLDIGAAQESEVAAPGQVIFITED